MESELKHLAAYLPYELRVLDIIDKNILLLGPGQFNTGIDIFRLISLREIYKPILRPLSDLTKEIEVNGEKFIPIERLTNMAFINYEMGLLTIDKDMNLKDYFKLLEWHFDIFELIPNGLAIDINTVENGK